MKRLVMIGLAALTLLVSVVAVAWTPVKYGEHWHLVDAYGTSHPHPASECSGGKRLYELWSHSYEKYEWYEHWKDLDTGDTWEYATGRTRTDFSETNSGSTYVGDC